ncbi:MAG: excinuclease ABC subunit UvrA [bacterium]
MSKPEHSPVTSLAALSARSADEDILIVRGAREHNLKNVSIELPKRSLVVFTGPSGSGKSSMAFDTIFAEGRRRYVESMSIYARQFLGSVDKPDVEMLTGLAPAISIEQQTTVNNPRSTVGTVTEIYDHLRILWAQLANPLPDADGPQSLSEAEIVEAVAGLPEGTRFMLLAPLVRNRKGEFKDVFEHLRKGGFTRARVDGEVVELEGLEKVELKKKHDIDVVIDRLIAKPNATDRLAESVERALVAGEGRMIVLLADTQATEIAYVRHAAARDVSHQTFSFNSPVGWCPSCRGIGTMAQVAPDLLVVNPSVSLNDGAIAAIGRDPEREAKNFAVTKEVAGIWKALQTWASEGGPDLDKPFSALSKAQRDEILRGRRGGFPGLVSHIAQARKKAHRQAARDFFDEFFEPATCEDCRGQRLNANARSFAFHAKTISEVCDLNISDAHAWFSQLKLRGREAVIGTEVVHEIIARLQFLVGVGLGYLSLNRSAETLSGGENQRMRLASQLGSELSGVLYVLDEPSIGLHQRDNRKLLETLQSLRDRGNSIIVVEHDRETMELADWVVDFGPGAGTEGGEVVAQGPPSVVMNTPGSITGDYLAGRRELETPAQRRPGNGEFLEVLGGRHHNLKNVDIKLPVATFTCVTGVSGAGKSTVVNDIILPAIQRNVFFKHRSVGEVDEIRGLEHFDKVIEIDQSPIGRTPRSNPATYTKLFDLIRALFAGLPESKMYGFNQGRFSFNVAGGRCEECQGGGVKKVEMGFLADVFVQCDLCHGQRFNHTTLMVRYKGKNISDVLNLTIADAYEFFKAQPKIARVLKTLLDVGLDYVQLGQSSTTLSGGEAQRVKLSRELAKVATGRTLYVLDEPSTGLHFDDIRRLLQVVDQLVDAGNTVLMIEHNLDIIKAADWIIDMGPEGGDAGGHVVAVGTPEKVAKSKNSHTGRFLAEVL